MKKLAKNIILVVSCAMSLSAQAQPSPQEEEKELNIQFDLENARQTLTLLKKKSVTEKELKAWSALRGTVALVKKVRSSTDTAISALRKVIQKETLTAEEKKFQYDQIINSIADLDSFITKLESRKDSIISDLQSQLKSYMPPGKKATITLYGLMGSYSAGFAFTKDPTSFYLGLHFYMGDMNAVSVSAKHELFHTLQTVGYDYEPVMEKLTVIDSSYEAPYYLIRHLYLEGSAEHISESNVDFRNSPYLKREQEHASVNKFRRPAVFYLLDRLLLDTYRNRNAMDFEQVYSILFDWNWNNPAYYAGKEMMASLVKEYGESYVKKSLGRDALFFVKDYIDLAKTGKQPDMYVFSPEFEEMVNGMVKKMD